VPSVWRLAPGHMILYDSHHWRAFVRIRGSVFPRAVLSSLPSCAAAVLLRWAMDEYKWPLREDSDVLTNNTIYSGFTYVLGFVLVFRTSQSYLRYWFSATSVHAMRSTWFDACASLVAFAHASKHMRPEVDKFTHTVIRLFGLLHAMALEEVAGICDVDFPLLDVEGLAPHSLEVLGTAAAQGRKVEIVMFWIKHCIMRGIDDKTLTVPPPILTRVFQEMGAGLVNFHEAQQVVIWPFPFPYAQMNVVLIIFYMLLTPVVVSFQTTRPWISGVYTLISVTCMVGVDVIATELENPFGDDPNDLPMRSMQLAMNRDLIFLVHPASAQVPTLTDQAVLSFDELFRLNQEQAGVLQRRNRSSLFEEDDDLIAEEESMKSSGSSRSRSHGELSDGGGSRAGGTRHQRRSSLARFTTVRQNVRDSVQQTARGLASQVRQIGGSKQLERQRCWAQQEWPEGAERVRHKLKLPRPATIMSALAASADTTDGAVQQLKEEITGLNRFAPGAPSPPLMSQSDHNGKDLDSVLASEVLWAHLQQEAVQQQHHLEAMENLMRSESIRRQKQIAIMEQLVRSASRVTNLGSRTTPQISVSTAGFERV